MFKYGDKIKCVDNGNFPLVLTVGKIYEVQDCNDDFVYVNEYKGGFFHNRFELAEKAWTPQPGEEIEVRRSVRSAWTKRKFFAFDGDSVVCPSHEPCRYTSWPYYRKYRPTHTLTLDNKSIEVDEETFQKVKSLFTEED